MLAESPEAGLCLIEDWRRGAYYMFNHLEYDTDTLKTEYFRDLARGLTVALPQNYFPEANPLRRPVNLWLESAKILFSNWIEEVARARARAKASERCLSWLLQDWQGPQAAAVPSSDFLLCSQEPVAQLPEVLRALGDQGLTPGAVRIEREGTDGAAMVLRFDSLAARKARRVATRLLSVDGVWRVAYRSARGKGAVLTGPPPKGEPDRDIVSAHASRTDIAELDRVVSA